MKLKLYSIFHLNLAYSSIEEEQRLEVIRRCYWPLLHLVKDYDLRFGFEASAYTLQTIAQIDPNWVTELRRLLQNGSCEFIGSGYSQIIGPLVPAEVNTANLRLGRQLYEQLLDVQPQLALINEQAYSAGMIQHYLDAGYRAIIMEWDNPARCHRDWNTQWRYLPQIACGQHGEEIPLIWNRSIAFQKFQRYAHGEMEKDEYLNYLCQYLSDRPCTFPLYGNDAEVFDYRPGRYHTEAVLREESEWLRIRRLFETLLRADRFEFIFPHEVLDWLDEPGAGNRLHLESPEQPIPVKKQGKYNLTRWAVTGRDDLGINTICWRIFEALQKKQHAADDDWRELCYLWSSDFRTHIAEKRWLVYRKRLAAFEKKILGKSGQSVDVEEHSRSLSQGGSAYLAPSQSEPFIKREGRSLTIESDTLKVQFNCRRGLSVEALWFKTIWDQPLTGTLQHGYYDDINLGADFYTGHLIFERPGSPKITDLNPVEPQININESNGSQIVVTGNVPTELGTVEKIWLLDLEKSSIKLSYRLSWPQLETGSLRLGHLTLLPAAFDKYTFYYRTHNGGLKPETFYAAKTEIDHGHAVSFLVSASHGIGMTEGLIEVGDAKKSLQIQVDKTTAALIGLFAYRELGNTFFSRLIFSAREVDETCRYTDEKAEILERPISFSMSAGRAQEVSADD